VAPAVPVEVAPTSIPAMLAATGAVVVAVT
jgi:hypothetical protein